MVLLRYPTPLPEASGACSVHLKGRFLVGTSPGGNSGGRLGEWIFRVFSRQAPRGQSRVEEVGEMGRRGTGSGRQGLGRDLAREYFVEM